MAAGGGAGARAPCRWRGTSPEADARAQPERVAVAWVMAAATIVFGIFPAPLFELARDVGTSLSNFV